MAKKSHYQSMLDDLSAWLERAARDQVVSSMDVIDQAKRYLQAAEEIGEDEMDKLEYYITRDLFAFSEDWQREAERSVWLTGIRQSFWRLLGSMSDKNQLEMVEMQMDIDHRGVYHSGELIAHGTLKCLRCGHTHSVEFVEQIPPCIECANTSFSRTNEGVTAAD